MRLPAIDVGRRGVRLAVVAGIVVAAVAAVAGAGRSRGARRGRSSLDDVAGERLRRPGNARADRQGAASRGHGVTSRFLTIEALAGTVPEQAAQLPGHGQVIAIVPTRPLAEGHGGPFWMPKPFPHPTDLLQPAVQHAPDFDHGREALFAVPLYNLGGAGNLIEVLAIEPKEAPYNGVPGVFKQLVPVVCALEQLWLPRHGRPRHPAASRRRCPFARRDQPAQAELRRPEDDPTHAGQGSGRRDLVRLPRARGQ